MSLNITILHYTSLINNLEAKQHIIVPESCQYVNTIKLSFLTITAFNLMFFFSLAKLSTHCYNTTNMLRAACNVFHVLSQIYVWKHSASVYICSAVNSLVAFRHFSKEFLILYTWMLPYIIETVIVCDLWQYGVLV